VDVDGQTPAVYHIGLIIKLLKKLDEIPPIPDRRNSPIK
jgi:hypothetical protein